MPCDRVNGTIGSAVLLDAPKGEAGTPFPTFFFRLSVWGLFVWPSRRVSVVSEVQVLTPDFWNPTRSGRLEKIDKRTWKQIPTQNTSSKARRKSGTLRTLMEIATRLVPL